MNLKCLLKCCIGIKKLYIDAVKVLAIYHPLGRYLYVNGKNKSYLI